MINNIADKQKQKIKGILKRENMYNFQVSVTLHL